MVISASCWRLGFQFQYRGANKYFKSGFVSQTGGKRSMVNMTQHDVKNLRFTINRKVHSIMEVPLSPTWRSHWVLYGGSNESCWCQHRSTKDIAGLSLGLAWGSYSSTFHIGFQIEWIYVCTHWSSPMTAHQRMQLSSVTMKGWLLRDASTREELIRGRCRPRMWRCCCCHCGYSRY